MTHPARPRTLPPDPIIDLFEHHHPSSIHLGALFPARAMTLWRTPASVAIPPDDQWHPPGAKVIFGPLPTPPVHDGTLSPLAGGSVRLTALGPDLEPEEIYRFPAELLTHRAASLTQHYRTRLTQALARHTLTVDLPDTQRRLTGTEAHTWVTDTALHTPVLLEALLVGLDSAPDGRTPRLRRTGPHGLLLAGHAGLLAVALSQDVLHLAELAQRLAPHHDPSLRVLPPNV